MPGNPQDVARRAGTTLDDLLIKNEEKEIDLLASKPKFPRRETKMYRLCCIIYSMFESLLSRYDPENPVLEIPSCDFDFLTQSPMITGSREQFSYPSVIKARKMLGITSIRRKDAWYWQLPRYAPDAASQVILSRKLKEWKLENNPVAAKIQIMTRPVTRLLAEVMQAHNYAAPASDIYHSIFLHPEGKEYARQTIVKAKSFLGIVSLKIDGEWYWIYPAKEVQEWLLEELSNGPVVLESLLKKADQTKSWHRELIRLSRLAVGGITSCLIDGRHGWRMR